jgi:hypothetical protein
MTKRYYIAGRVGDGTQDNPYNSEMRVWLRENLPDEPKHLKQVIAHTIPWVLHKYNLGQAAHDSVMASLTGIFSFPGGALDRPLSDIPANNRQAIRGKLESIGFSFGWATLTHTIRDVLEYIAHSIQLSEWADVQIAAANFDTNKTVGDIPAEARQRIAQHMADLGIDTDGVTLSTTIGETLRMVQRQPNGSLRLFGTASKRPWFFHDEDTE